MKYTLNMGNLRQYLGCRGNSSSSFVRIVETRLPIVAGDFAVHLVNKNIINDIGIK